MKDTSSLIEKNSVALTNIVIALTCSNKQMHSYELKLNAVAGGRSIILNRCFMYVSRDQPHTFYTKGRGEENL